MKKAFFPGSFDPFTKGHLNIFSRACPIFDKIVIGIGRNSLKKGFFDIDTRKRIINESIENYFMNLGNVPDIFEKYEIVDYDSLTIDACKKYNCDYIVRGVRNMLDFENERAIADANKKINSSIDTILIPTEQAFGHISSTAVRDILIHNGDTSDFTVIDLKKYVPYLYLGLL